MVRSCAFFRFPVCVCVLLCPFIVCLVRSVCRPFLSYYLFSSLLSSSARDPCVLDVCSLDITVTQTLPQPSLSIPLNHRQPGYTLFLLLSSWRPHPALFAAPVCLPPRLSSLSSLSSPVTYLSRVSRPRRLATASLILPPSAALRACHCLIGLIASSCAIFPFDAFRLLTPASRSPSAFHLLVPHVAASLFASFCSACQNYIHSPYELPCAVLLSCFFSPSPPCISSEPWLAGEPNL